MNHFFCVVLHLKHHFADILEISSQFLSKEVSFSLFIVPHFSRICGVAVEY